MSVIVTKVNSTPAQTATQTYKTSNNSQFVWNMPVTLLYQVSQCVFIATLLSATGAKKVCGLSWVMNVLKLIKTQDKKGLVMHSQCVLSIVYNSPEIATITASLTAHCIYCTLSFSSFPSVFPLFLSDTNTHTHSSMAVVHYGVVTRQRLIAIIGSMYRAACLITC